MNVPRPERGYWAKLKVGKAPSRPAFPPAEPGCELEWARGGEARLFQPRLLSPPPRRRRSTTPPITPRPDIHPLCSGVRHFFVEGRVSQTGYLRPLKQLLVDLFVSEASLDRALELASKFFLDLEDHGHRVVIAPVSEKFHRPDLLTSEHVNKNMIRWESWSPCRPTVVYIGSVAYGLTIYELSEQAEVEYGDRTYVRVTEATRLRRSRYRHPDFAWTHTEAMPSGLFALRAYSPYSGVKWEQHWQEKEAGDFLKRFDDIRRTLKRTVESVIEQVEEEKRREEERHRQWELQKIKWQREAEERRKREEEQRKREEYKRSREQLLAVIESWSLACRIEDFFESVEHKAKTVGDEEREEILARLETARQMFGGTNVLDHFERWIPANPPDSEADPSEYEDDDEPA